MTPVRVDVNVTHAREDVYDFLDVLANHELFTDHMLCDWSYEGPACGVGAKARVTAVAGRRREALAMGWSRPSGRCATWSAASARAVGS